MHKISHSLTSKKYKIHREKKVEEEGEEEESRGKGRGGRSERERNYLTQKIYIIVNI